MPGCFGQTLRFFSCRGRPYANENTDKKKVQEYPTTFTSDRQADATRNESQIIIEDDSRCSATRINIAMSKIGSAPEDYPNKTELELMFDLLLNNLYSKTSKVKEKSEEEIVQATQTLLPIVRLDYEDGTKEDLIDIYSLCHDIIKAKVFDNAIGEFLVLANQRLLVWDALDPSSKLLASSMAYLDQFPESRFIDKTKSFLQFCKADLFRRQGRLNDSLILVTESEGSFQIQTPEDDDLKTYGLTVKSLTLSNLLQKDEAAREAEVALKMLKERKDSYANSLKSELAFILRVRNTMGALKVLQDVCGGLASLRDGDEHSVRVRNARIRLGMWHFLDSDFEKCFSLWKCVFVLDQSIYCDDTSWPAEATAESIIGLNDFGLPNLDDYTVRNASLKLLIVIHFFRQRILGAYHPSVKFIEKWLVYDILQ